MRSLIEKNLQCTTHKYDEFTTTIEHKLVLCSVTNVVDSAFEDSNIDYDEYSKQQAVRRFCNMLMGDEVRGLRELVYDMSIDRTVQSQYAQRLYAILEEIV